MDHAVCANGLGAVTPSHYLGKVHISVGNRVPAKLPDASPELMLQASHCKNSSLRSAANFGTVKGKKKSLVAGWPQGLKEIDKLKIMTTIKKR